ncbi:MAG: class I SAM-dependent methyltransferase [Calditrichaeota bacterium]|nr:class I SAM-dependent methyltransferase [Calditrichota bacterium]RQW02787.1 MAG: class I SAM-dependent methyltransferase [Calditrichota bacterium]
MPRSLWKIKSLFYHAMRLNPVSYLILKNENEIIYSFLDLIPGLSSGIILDIGSGRGNSLKILAGKSDFVVGTDFSHSMLKRTASQLHDFHYVVADARNLPFLQNTADIITAIGITEYLEDIGVFLSETVRIVKNRGYIIITTSPPGFLSRLRILLGHRLHPWKHEDIIDIYNRFPLKIIESRKTILQHQFLLQKSE